MDGSLGGVRELKSIKIKLSCFICRCQSEVKCDITFTNISANMRYRLSLALQSGALSRPAFRDFDPFIPTQEIELKVSVFKTTMVTRNRPR